MSEKKISLVLVDDHQLFTQSLSNLLSRYEFVGTITIFHNVKEYLQSGLVPDIIVSDLMMPDMTGIDLLTAYKQQKQSVKIIILSSVIEVQTIRHALRNGARGYLSKDTSIEELADALLTVQSGESYIGENLRKSLLRNTLTEDRMIYNLSPREKEVLHGVCSGKTIKEVAYDLELSIHTVQTYYKTIMKKL